MKKTFEDYRKAMEGVGVRPREAILARAERDPDLLFEDFLRLCRLADPEGAWA